MGVLRRLERPKSPSGRAHSLIRVSRTETAGERGGHPTPAARIEILYRRALITSQDLSPEAEEERRAYRRTDLAAAEKLIEANGGRLVRPRRDAG